MCPLRWKKPVDSEPAEDPFYDPFARTTSRLEERVRSWNLNTKVFEVQSPGKIAGCSNRSRRGYNKVVPNPVQIGISNLFYNMRFPSRLINNLAQRNCPVQVPRSAGFS